MARELRALMYDNDAGEITRPDIPAALSSSPGDGDVRASGFHPRQERELAPYTAMPVLPSRLNEPTVPDAALKMSMARAEVCDEHTVPDTALKVSMARAGVRDEHTPSDAGRPPRSGPRHGAPSAPPPAEMKSTVPPPGRTRSKQSIAPDSGRARKQSLPPESAGFAARARVTAKATPAALREPERPSMIRAAVLVVGTAVVAALIGVGLGNGSIERVFSSAPPVEAPAPPVARVAPPRVTASPVLAPAPAPVAVPVDEGPKVPVMRLDQLPSGEASATPEAKPAPKAVAKPARKGSRH